jgi:hypothetical protein
VLASKTGVDSGPAPAMTGLNQGPRLKQLFRGKPLVTERQSNSAGSDTVSPD